MRSSTKWRSFENSSSRRASGDSNASNEGAHDMESNGRTALITGASRGLGLALARELARRRWQLIIDARGADALDAAAQDLGALTHVIAIPGDVADAGHRLALAAAARDAGRIDL